jgi:FtsH-binding integral membrane protein
MLGRLENVIGMAGLLTLCIVIGTGFLGYYLGDKIITFDWDKYLGMALFALIVISFAGPFFIKDIETLISFYYAISIGGLIIFTLLLLSNHKKLKENSEKCVNSTNPPNYPLESFNIVIKIANIFQDLIQILAIRKRRR